MPTSPAVDSPAKPMRPAPEVGQSVPGSSARSAGAASAHRLTTARLRPQELAAQADGPHGCGPEAPEAPDAAPGPVASEMTIRRVAVLRSVPCVSGSKVEEGKRWWSVCP